MSEFKHGGLRVPAEGKKLRSTKVERLARQERQNPSGAPSIASIANCSASSASDASVGDVRLRGQLEARLTLRKKLSKHRELRALLGVAPSRHGGPARMDLPTCNLQASAERKACEHTVSLLCDEMESLCSNLEFCWGKQISTPKKTSTPKMLSTPKMQNFLGGGGLTPPHP